MLTGADILIQRLRDFGVRHVFGYPGGQLTPIYDALYREPAIRHILARDEQGAAFMADGYARATGKPGVCFAVCGPGVYNAATPLASALADSIPMLLVSGQIVRAPGLRSGYYHENEQLDALKTLTKWQSRAERPEAIPLPLEWTFRRMPAERPGPVFLEVPLDAQRAAYEGVLPVPESGAMSPPAPSDQDIENLAKILSGWRRPLLMVGGGVTTAGAEALVQQLADRLGAPVFHTFMGKAAISSHHRLKAGLPWRRATSDLTDMESLFSPLFAEADGLLAIGCRFTQAATASWKLPVPRALAQIDIDAQEIGRHYPVSASVVADAKLALKALLSALPAKNREPWALPESPAEPWRLPGWDLVGPLRRALPEDAVVVADITRLSYILLAEFPVYQPRTFLHPAGFVPMGYGIPAAIGAKTARPNAPVVAVVGDGCFLMSGMELATAVQEKLPIVVILINDSCLTLIKAIQQRRYESRFMGVDLCNPDFGLFAKAFGVRAWRVENDIEFERALQQALNLGETALIEVMLRG